ncbi:polyketide synthase dehydratase domain-containing protein, partial [Streptomyces sp. NK08204]|uniref:polyketide synthase dehydratase domain-containing protein n=1 Tax=Streptomyces sp. NK08204 TaxID=2873260 RepID=UPI001CEC1C29
VADVTLLPGTAFVELALQAGDAVGCDRVEELTMEAPLVLPEEGGVRIQLVVAAPTDAGRRRVTVYSRPETGPAEPDADPQWTRHATGVLAASGPAVVAASADLAVWPPADAEPLDIDGMYERFNATGLGYGPVFQGLRAAWRRGEEVFATIALPAEQRDEAGRFRVHPALLDAALHAMALGGFVARSAEPQIRLPFAWNGVSLQAVGAPALRVRLAPAGSEAISLTVADESGRPVASVESLAVRTVSPDQLASARQAFHESLFRLDWTALPAPAGAAGSTARWAVLDGDASGLLPLLKSAVSSPVASHPDLAALGRELGSDGAAPELVFAACAASPAGADVASVHGAAHRALE